MDINTSPVTGLPLSPTPLRCAECGGTTRDPFAHAARYAHDFRPVA